MPILKNMLSYSQSMSAREWDKLSVCAVFGPSGSTLGRFDPLSGQQWLLRATSSTALTFMNCLRLGQPVGGGGYQRQANRDGRRMEADVSLLMCVPPASGPDVCASGHTSCWMIAATKWTVLSSGPNCRRTL